MESKTFVTIREAAKRPDTPTEWALRRMAHEGKLPGFYAASRFYINLPQLLERLEALSMEAIANG